MTVESTMIQEVTVTAQEELIETGKTSDIVSAEEIKNLPYRNLSQIVGTTAGVFHQDGSGSGVRGRAHHGRLRARPADHGAVHQRAAPRATAGRRRWRRMRML